MSTLPPVPTTNSNGSFFRTGTASASTRSIPSKRSVCRRLSIASGFRTVWALDLLTFLHENTDSSFTSDELIAALRASDVVVSQSVGNLAALGLVVVDSQGRVALHEASPQQAQLVRAAIDFYRRSPDKVRRLIVSQAAPGLTAFADAFKLRKD